MRRKWLRVLLAGALILGLVAIFGSASALAKGKDTVVISQKRDVATLDWIMDTAMETNTVSRCVFNSLIDLQPDASFAGSLATSWEVLDDLTWRFELRKGVKFHNGDPFDAEDVKFTLERVKDPEVKSRWAWLVKEIAEVKVVDPYKIELKTTSPQPGLLAKLTYIPIVPHKVVKTHVNPDFGLHPVGTGPYRFVEWVKDEHVKLSAYEGYWGGEPKIKYAIFRPIPEGSSRTAALLAGEIDVVIGVPPSQWKEVNKNSTTRIACKNGTMIYLGLDTLKPPMDNLKVRQAMNHAVNVQEIIDTVLEGTAVRMNGPFHEGTLGYDASIKPYPYNPEKAKKLLAEAGYPNGFDTVLSTPPTEQEGATNMQEVSQAIAYQLSKVGIKVKVEPQEIAVLWPRYQNQELKTYLFSWPERWEPERYLRALFHSKARGYYYRNPEADRLLDEGAATFDRNKRIEVYKKLHRHLFEDAPWVFLYKQMVGFGVKKALAFEAPFDGYVKPWEWSWKE